MKVFIAGGSGMLGLDICQVMAQSNYEVIKTDRQTCDITDWGRVREMLRHYRPNFVVNLAAVTNVDYCETHPDDAYRTHYIGTKNLALMCAEIDATLIYISSGCVFGGAQCTPYTEFDPCTPVSHYARSKYAGEQAVQQILHKYYIVRSGWLFSGNEVDKKFVMKILNLARNHEWITVVDDKYGSPTYTVDLAHGIRQLFETEHYGLYHIVNDGDTCNRYEYATKILEYAGITNCEVIASSSSSFNLAAHRPNMEAIRNYKLELMGWRWMRPWTEALKECIETRYADQIAMTVRDDTDPANH